MYKCCNGKKRGIICSIGLGSNGRSYPFRTLYLNDKDDTCYSVSVESLADVLKNKDGDIRKKYRSIDDMFVYYVPDLCILLPDEDLIPGIETIRSGGDADMYFEVTATNGKHARYYDTLRTLSVCEELNKEFDIPSSCPDDHAFVATQIEELFQLEIEPEITIHKFSNGNDIRIAIRFGTMPS